MPCPDSFRPLVFTSMSYDWHHSAAVSLHCPVYIMVLALICPELPPLPCSLFSPRSAVLGSSLGFALVSHALFHFLPIPFIALSGSAGHVPSYWLRMRLCIIGNCQFSLVSCLSSKSQPFHSEPHKILDSSQWTFLRFFFSAVAAKSVRLVISRSDQLYQDWDT